MTLSFFTVGKPQTAGSKSAVPTPAGPRVIEAGSSQSRARKRTWRHDLQGAALAAMNVQDVRQFAGPVAVTMVFIRKRPSGHLRTGSNAGEVKAAAAELQPIQRPDLLKTARLAEDALTGVVWVDDSQIVNEMLVKQYPDAFGLPPHVEGLWIRVRMADADLPHGITHHLVADVQRATAMTMEEAA